MRPCVHDTFARAKKLRQKKAKKPRENRANPPLDYPFIHRSAVCGPSGREGIPMKSFIADTLRQVEDNQKLTQNAPTAPTGSQEDAELEKLLEGLRVDVRILGCGGGGSNTINRLVESGIHGAELFALNTDASHLLHINSPHKILLGRRLTRGLGAGALPQVGEEAAREAQDDIKRHVSGADIAFITCGMGGGTGTGSAPFVAKMAKDAGALTIGVVTMPFSAEGHT